MQKVIFWVFNLFAPLLFGGVAEHVKPCPHKSDGISHSMPGIDFIYMINLDGRPEKYSASLSQLTPYGIFPYRFSAVNGWELSLEDINDVGVKFSAGMRGGFMGTSYHLDSEFFPSHEIICNEGQTYFCHCTARGTIGIWLSHYSVLRDAYDSGYETVWVMEDDIEVRRDPRILSDLIVKLDVEVGKGNWDILFTDRDIRSASGEYVSSTTAAKRPDYVSRNNFALRRQISPDFFEVGSRYGAHSMIIRRSGMQKLLEFMTAHQQFLPYDMDYTLPKGIKFICVTEDVVTNLPKAPTDNGAPNYLKKGD